MRLRGKWARQVGLSGKVYADGPSMEGYRTATTVSHASVDATSTCEVKAE